MLKWINTLLDRLLHLTKQWIDRRDLEHARKLGTDHGYIKVRTHNASFNCQGCGFFSAYGWTVNDANLCNVCAGPVLREMWKAQRGETRPVVLAGDPR